MINYFKNNPNKLLWILFINIVLALLTYHCYNIPLLMLLVLFTFVAANYQCYKEYRDGK
jgi:hypothetical protein